MRSFSTDRERRQSVGPRAGAAGVPASGATTGSLESRVSFEAVRYANCWEDADVLCAALRPRAGARILSVGSAGDNALALAAEGAEVVVVDVSAAQLACVELRRAAFRRLDHEGVLGFLGVRPAADRLATLRQLKRDLSPFARDFWVRRPRLVAAGIVHAGKLEGYFRLFRQCVLPLVHPHGRVARLLEPRPAAGRREFYDEEWNCRRWRWLFRLFFSRVVLGRLGRDPEFLRHAGDRVAERLLARVRRGLTSLPTDRNPYLELILTGSFSRSLPRYLERERFDAVREGVERLTFHLGTVDAAARVHAAGGFDGFNLSDVFEYLDLDECSRVYSTLLDAARPGARLAYWNLLVPRRHPSCLDDRVCHLPVLSRSLLARDRAFFYDDFRVDEVRAEPRR